MNILDSFRNIFAIHDLRKRVIFSFLLLGVYRIGSPVEAQACGRPVVALSRGGATETVVDGKTGILVDDASAPAFADGISRALTAHFDSGAIRRHAERFSRERFVDEITKELAALPSTGSGLR